MYGWWISLFPCFLKKILTTPVNGIWFTSYFSFLANAIEKAGGGSKMIEMMDIGGWLQEGAKGKVIIFHLESIDK